jgi:diguanylate cyclase (GGDEF)-like protein/PAS domain S-box-containing protein
MRKKSSKPVAAIADAAIGGGEAASAAAAVSLSALKEQAAGLRWAQSLAGLAHVVTRPDGSFESWSETLPDLIGVRADHVVDSTRKWLDLIHPADRGLFRDTALAAREHGTRAHVEYRLWHRGGKWVHVRQVMEPIPGKRDAQGRARWFNTLQDITVQKLAEERISRLNRVYAVLSGINAVIVRARERDRLFAEACRIAVEQGGFRMAWIGMADRETWVVKPVASYGDVRGFFDGAPLILRPARQGRGMAWQAIDEKHPVISDDIQNDPRTRMKEQCRERGVNSLAMLPLIVENQGIGVLALYGAESGFFDDEEVKLLLQLAGDISFAIDYIEKSERINHLAYYDALTGLANRTLFHERLEQQLAMAKPSGRPVAAIVIDIERFRVINESLGRQAGDQLLKQVAERMLAKGVDAARLSRLAANHFGVMLTNAQSAEEVGRRLEKRLPDFFGAPFRIAGADLRLSARAGIAIFPGDGADAETLIRNAEAALIKAKASGERYLFYTEKMTERVAEKLSLENRLRQALEREEFVLHYQPKVDLASRRMIGMEALIRWQSPDVGLVPPAQFISLMEETGLILPVGQWALGRAALDATGWLQQGVVAPPIAVNVSAAQLRHRDFVEVVRDAISALPAPARLDIEITESLLMHNLDEHVAKLQAIRNLGVKIAIDDFGTGHSSLAYLAKLPVDSLKIDRSFIKTMLNDPNTMNVVQMVISLARSMRLTVVAEGVESEEQARMLHFLRCDQMQGYLVSKPLPPGDVIGMLQKTGTASG